ncbi:hypothetical protein ACF087_36690 [Streptomyces goshikiensis]|uniref:hypothetical protein n=1 Tax=Streptomyces goshikiensis TaxID=1942 RepID=UPI0036FF9C92
MDDAWYSGDPRRLARLHGGGQEQNGRWRLWGRREQPAPGRRDNRLQVPLPGDIATTSAVSTVTHFPTIYMIGVTHFPTLTVTLPHGDGGCECTPTGRALTRCSPMFI